MIEKVLASIDLTTVDKNTQLNPKKSHLFGIECLGICGNLRNGPWSEIDRNYYIIEFLNKIFNNTKKSIIIDDNILLLTIIFSATLCQYQEIAEKIVKNLPEFLNILISIFFLNLKKF